MKQYFALGSYTEPILFGTGEVFQGKGKGVSICAFEDGEITELKSIAVRNPSFVAIDEKNSKIYAVNEMKEYLGAFGGGVTQLSYDGEGNMKEECTYNVGGTDPCHIIAAPNGRFISIANFASGSVSTFSLDEKGNMTGEMELKQHEGSSIHPIRQRGPHAHSSIFAPDTDLMFVPDLGTDELVAYRYDEKGITKDEDATIAVSPGCGPRYGEFGKDGKNFYLINEIGSRVMHYTYENGVMTLKKEVSTLPEGWEGDNICSDLHITSDGKYLYASNRGHDSITGYKIEADGSLTWLMCTPCGGKTPRNFALDNKGKYILVENQDTDTIVVFTIEEDGCMTQGKTFAFGSPVCIQFFKNTAF